MLSDTDIQYIAAFLYVAGGKPASVTVGQKLYDVGAQEKRDVDIAILCADRFGIVAAEVKNHARPLDTTIVEGLCKKFEDMPAVSERAIVSTSGYTSPAIRKAKCNGVACLTLRRGPLPRFKTVDVSRLTHVKVDDTEWAEGPEITFISNAPLTSAEHTRLTKRTRFKFREFSLSAAEFRRQLQDHFDLGWLRLSVGESRAIGVIVELAEPARIRIGKREVSIPAARLEGVVTRTKFRLPLSESCYLADERGEPFAATLIFELGDRLLGVTTSTRGFVRRYFHISAVARRKRPVGIQIVRNTA